MPLIRVECNTRVESDAAAAFIAKASEKTSEILGKSENYVMCILDDNRNMSFAGNTDATAYIEFKSIGLPEDKTTELSAAVCELVSATLGIASDRIYIEFANAQRHMWGWNNRTF